MLELSNMRTPQAVRALAALAQDTRLAIYRMLVQQGPEGLAAGTIAARLDLPAPTLSFHLKEMTNAALIEPRQEGRFVYYSTNYDQMNALLHFLSENCCQGASAAALEPRRKLKRSRRSASRRRP
jgi:DNA-binding transcriptional ArsR family regulator